MNNMNANNSIKCSVSSCTHHNSATRLRVIQFRTEIRV